MAKRILAQTSPFGKVEINPYVNSVAERFKTHENPIYQHAGYALTMTNDEAVDFLRENGFAQIIPGTHFATVGDYAEFLGIPASVVQGYIYRHGLDRERNPVEAISAGIQAFFQRAGLTKIGKPEILKENRYRGIFDFHFEKSDTHYVTEWTRSTKLYTARVVMAMLPFISASQKGLSPDHKSVALYDKLLLILEAKQAEDMAKAKAKEAAASVVQAAVSEEVLYNLIKKAVGEVLSGAKVEMTAPFTITT